MLLLLRRPAALGDWAASDVRQPLRPCEVTVLAGVVGRLAAVSCLQMGSRKQAAQVLVVREQLLLLCFNKTGTFKGLYTGIIAVCGVGETPAEAALRACLGAGLVLGAGAAPQLRAILDMVEGGDVVEEHEFVLRNGDVQGAPKGNRAASYEWFSLDKIPYADMPEDDSIWYPPMLCEGKLLRGSFSFADEGMTEHSIQVVDAL